MDDLQPVNEVAGRLLRGIGFSTASLPNRSLAEALRVGAATGLRAVELLGFAGYRHTAGDLAGVYLDSLDREQIEELAAIVAGFEHVSIHAPFWDVGPFSPNPGIRAETRRQFEENLRVAGRIGAETVTTHVTPKRGYDWDEYRDDVIAYYRSLGDIAEDAGVTVTIETGFPREIHEFAALIHGIDHESVGANIDVGHLRGLLAETERQPETLGQAYNALLCDHVRSLGERIYHLHIHDVRAEDGRDHRECGTGIIDYEALFSLLIEEGYEGLAIFELEEADDIGALERSRDLISAAIQRAGRGRAVAK